ncbi:hypothetical protein PVL29_010020 [Vitis rotundifolia]|uniref:Uncharacterized protein n=1 Tax=Vitis rotundifolia TaxID=103349 RepID=A0AA38ZSU8_VITRO|nr:hypothetical protein PVL29_010020 [Vitis rotundifolia]
MPLSQTLITPDLALAFDIRNPNSPQAPPPPLPTPQGLSAGGGGGGGGGGAGGGAGLAAADPATDHLFASSPVPPHFLHPGRASSEHFLPFVPVAALQQHHHHHQQMAVAAAAVAAHPQLQTQYHHHRQVGHFGSPPNGQFEHPFLAQSGTSLCGGPGIGYSNWREKGANSFSNWG